MGLSTGGGTGLLDSSGGGRSVSHGGGKDLHGGILKHFVAQTLVFHKASVGVLGSSKSIILTLEGVQFFVSTMNLNTTLMRT